MPGHAASRAVAEERARTLTGVTRKPPNVEWLGFTKEQADLLDFLDFVGNNGWDRNGQSEALMPGLLARCWDAGLTMHDVQRAMESIGYSRGALHQLDRWESKRSTGRFGP